MILIKITKNRTISYPLIQIDDSNICKTNWLRTISGYCGRNPLTIRWSIIYRYIDYNDTARLSQALAARFYARVCNDSAEFIALIIAELDIIRANPCPSESESESESDSEIDFIDTFFEDLNDHDVPYCYEDDSYESS